MTPFQEWYKRYDEGGVDYLFIYDWKGRPSFLTSHEEADHILWIEQTFPRDTTQVSTYITQQYAISYSHSGLIKLLHRLGFDYIRPAHIQKQIDEAKQHKFIDEYEKAYKNKKIIHVFVDNARYHHAKALQVWLNEPDRRVKLHFILTISPHLNPIKRLQGRDAP